MDTEQLARELLTALRGKRSQVAWSRRLGYKGNVAYRWESGRRWPTAAETFRACRRANVDLDAAMAQFYGQPPAWVDQHEVDTPEGVAAMLDEMRGAMSIVDLSARSGLSRHAIGRWLKGASQPRLPDFLTYVEAATLRVADLLAALVDPEQLPTLRPLWARLEARREGAGRYPWTQAILRALELVHYKELPVHRPGWIASQLGIRREEEARCIAFLEETGQIRWDGARYVQDPLAVDTRRRPEVGRTLKGHWARLAAQRAERGEPGQFSYNVFTVSREGFEQIREEHLRYYNAMRAIVGSSEPGEVVAVVNVHLFALCDARGEDESIEGVG